MSHLLRDSAYLSLHTNRIVYIVTVRAAQAARNASLRYVTGLCIFRKRANWIICTLLYIKLKTKKNVILQIVRIVVVVILELLETFFTAKYNAIVSGVVFTVK